MSKNLTMDELLAVIDSLPYHKFKEVIDHYSAANKTDFQNEMDLMVTTSLQQKLMKLGVNSTCPYLNNKYQAEYQVLLQHLIPCCDSFLRRKSCCIGQQAFLLSLTFLRKLCL